MYPRHPQNSMAGFQYQHPQAGSNPTMGINNQMNLGNPMSGIVQHNTPNIYTSQQLPSPQSIYSTQNIQAYPYAVNTVGNVPMPTVPQYQNTSYQIPNIRRNSSNNKIPQVSPNSSYPIPPGQKDKYANIYALLMTIEELQSYYCVGRVSQDEYNQKIINLQAQFESARNIFNLSNDDIENFAQAFDMNVGYALGLLRKPISTTTDNNSTPKSDQLKPVEFVNLGLDWATLTDCCCFPGLPAEQFLKYILIIRTRLQNIGIYQRNKEVKDYTDKWHKTFSDMKPTEVVSDELKEELKNDIIRWKQIAFE